MTYTVLNIFNGRFSAEVFKDKDIAVNAYERAFFNAFYSIPEGAERFYCDGDIQEGRVIMSFIEKGFKRTEEELEELIQSIQYMNPVFAKKKALLIASMFVQGNQLTAGAETYYYDGKNRFYVVKPVDIPLKFSVQKPAEFSKLDGWKRFSIDMLFYVDSIKGFIEVSSAETYEYVQEAEAEVHKLMTASTH